MRQYWVREKYHLSPFQQQQQLRYISRVIHPEELVHSSSKCWDAKLHNNSSVASSVQSTGRDNLLCSCVVGHLHQPTGRWPWYIFWVLMRQAPFLLLEERVHQMAQINSNFEKSDKEQMLSTHYILNISNSFLTTTGNPALHNWSPIALPSGWGRESK